MPIQSASLLDVSTKTQSQHIKVMCFNVNSPGTDFEKKKSEIIAQIEAEDPDILYLPELGTAGNDVH